MKVMLVVVLLVSCGPPRGEVSRVGSPEPADGERAGAAIATEGPPAPAFTLLLQPRLPPRCVDEPPPPVVVACRQAAGAELERRCPELPRGSYPVIVTAGPGDGDYAVFPREVDLASNHRGAVPTAVAPTEDELRAIVATMLAAGTVTHQLALERGGREDPARGSIRVAGQPHPPAEERPTIAALRNPTVVAGFEVELTGDDRDDRLYVVHAEAVDSRGGASGARALVAVDATAPLRPVFVADAGHVELRVRGSFVFDGVPALVWVVYENPRVGCYQDRVFQIRGDVVEETVVFSACCR